MSLSSVHSVVETMLAGLAPIPDAEYRAHVLATQIQPTLGRWGFDVRFHPGVTEMHPKQRQAYQRLLNRMKCQGAIVALVGPRGLGKTTLAAQLALDTAWRNYNEGMKLDGSKYRPHVIYKKSGKLLARYRTLYSDLGSINTESLIDSMDYLCRHQEILVIDELHECDDLCAFNAMITDICDRRYACLRDTILIGNQTPSQFVAAAGGSIVSRLSQHGEIIECDWPSYRTPQP